MINFGFFLRFFVNRAPGQLQLLPISMAYCMWDLRIHLAGYEGGLIAQIWILRL